MMHRFLVPALIVAASSLSADLMEVPADVVAQMKKELDACGLRKECASHTDALTICAQAMSAGGAPSIWGMCQQAELDWWDAQLNSVYQQRMDGQKALDKELGGSHFEDALRDMQRAWIPFRDEKCNFLHRGQQQTGSGAANDVMECLIEETAAQTILLAERL